MAKEAQSAKIWKGDGAVLEILLENVGSTVGWKFYWAISVDANSVALLTKSTETTPAKITILESVAYVEIAPTDTDYDSSITAGNYYMELKAVNADDTPVTGLVGTLTVMDKLLRTEGEA